MNCGSCEHWGTAYESTRLHRTCQKVAFDNGDYKLAEDSAFGSDPAVRAARVRLAVVDSSDLWATLRTRAEFGCVLFEPRSDGSQGASVQ